MLTSSPDLHDPYDPYVTIAPSQRICFPFPWTHCENCLLLTSSYIIILVLISYIDDTYIYIFVYFLYVLFAFHFVLFVAVFKLHGFFSIT